MLGKERVPESAARVAHSDARALLARTRTEFDRKLESPPFCFQQLAHSFSGTNSPTAAFS